jgi:peptidoglycan/xylan/chitin deacetylase (PgdA/CDA1 family)
MTPAPLKRLRHFSYWAGLRATLPFSLWKGQCGTDGFGILMYHRICPAIPGISAPTWNVTPDRFREQLEYLIDRGYEPWRLTDLVEHSANNLPIPRRAFAVTFDDGYRCVANHALPILETLQIPATIFIATSLVGKPGPMPQDDWSDAGNELVPADYYEAFTLAECETLATHPLIELGSHSHSHQDFRGRTEDFIADIRRSAHYMKTHWHLDRIPFAFPYGCSLSGYCAQEMRDAVKELGFYCALTADARIIEPADDPFAWGRITATQQDSGRMLSAKLDNWYGAFKRFGLRYLPSAGTP